jgi:hypothetical protein
VISSREEYMFRMSENEKLKGTFGLKSKNGLENTEQ